MDLGYISPTKLEQMRMCMARLKARYTFDGEYAEEQGEPALSGTLAHGAAKIWYRFEATTPDEAFKKAIDECANYIDPQGKPNPQNPKTPSGLQDAREMFDLIVAHYKRDVVKVLFAERKYKGLLAGIPVSLIIDLIIDRGNGVMEIVDYKTGFITLSDDDMWDKDQVLLNLLAVSTDPELARFATKQFRYFWVRKGFESDAVHLSYEQLTDYQKLLAIDYQKILDTTDPEETINRFCKSCGRRNECKAYGAYLAEAYGLKEMGEVIKLGPEDVLKLTDDEVFGRYDRLKGQIEMLEENRSTLGNFIKGRMEQVQAMEVSGQKFKAAIQQNRKDEFSTTTVVALASQHGKDLSTLVEPKKKRVLAAFGSIPEAMTALNMTQQHGATTPFIMVRAVSNRDTKKKKTAKKDAVTVEAPVVQAPVENPTHA